MLPVPQCPTCTTLADRFKWVEGLSFRLGRALIGVRATETGWTSRLQGLLPRLCAVTDEPRVSAMYSLVVGGDGPRRGMRRFHLLLEGKRLVGRSMCAEDVLRAFEHDVAHRAALEPPALRLRAAAVAWRGEAILLPRYPGGGTASLVSALVGEGARLLSGGSVWLDLSGRVHPWIPLVGPETALRWPLGGLAALEAPPVGVVLLTGWRGEARWRPRQLTPGRGVLALLPLASLDIERCAEQMGTLRGVAERAVFLQGVRGEAVSCARSLLARG